MLKINSNRSSTAQPVKGAMVQHETKNVSSLAFPIIRTGIQYAKWITTEIPPKQGFTERNKAPFLGLCYFLIYTYKPNSVSSRSFKK
ncbi:MAG: hypothetical protein AAB767_03005 [Patescibacteria group bacterium]